MALLAVLMGSPFFWWLTGGVIGFTAGLILSLFIVLIGYSVFAVRSSAAIVRWWRGLSPLAKAAGDGRQELVQELAEKGALLDEVPTQGGAPALLVAVHYGWLDIAEFLLESGASVDAQGTIPSVDRRLVHVTPLHVAVLLRGAKAEAVQLLLRYNAAVDIPDPDGVTPLMVAANCGRSDDTLSEPPRDYDPVFAMLLPLTHDVNRCDNKGRTVLHHAANCGTADMVKALLARSADVNRRDDGGKTPLLLVDSFPEKANLLLASGADINVQDNNGKTPLMYAVRGLFSELFDFLLEQKPDLSLKDKEGKTVFDHAKEPSRFQALTLAQKLATRPEPLFQPPI